MYPWITLGSGGRTRAPARAGETLAFHGPAQDDAELMSAHGGAPSVITFELVYNSH